MSADLIPFGKYKGHPAETLLADPSYRDWLIEQPWFRERFVTLYQTVINYGTEPQESPEHNEMQAAFLDDALCLRLAFALHREPFDRPAALRRLAGTDEDAERCRRYAKHLTPSYEDQSVIHRRFEHNGWDVVYSVKPAVVTMKTSSLPDCICGPCSHDSCHRSDLCQGGKWACQHQRHEDRQTPSEEWLTAPRRLARADSFRAGDHCYPSCPWAVQRYGSDRGAVWLVEPDNRRSFAAGAVQGVLVECKPDLGDDFPTVLRQVTKYERGDGSKACVVVRRASFEKVTWDQVVAIFGASNVVLLRESLITGTTA